MKFYHEKEDRIIECSEMCSKYGTREALPALGIHALSVQPSYDPVSFNKLADGTYYPVESYDSMRSRAVNALVVAGYSEEEALEMIDNG